MAVLIAFPLFAILAIFQSAVVSRLPLLYGTADLVLLVIIAWALQERVRSWWQWALIGGFFIGYISAINVSVPITGYLVTAGVAILLRQRVWQIPILAMFAMTFLGTLLLNILTLIYLGVSGTLYPVIDTVNLIVLPGMILNLLLAVPVYALIKDLAEWVYPEEIEL